MALYAHELTEQSEIIPFGGEENCGASTGIDDATLAPADTGSDEPQDEGNERAAMADLKSMLTARAARIERETGGDCRIDALVSSSGSGADGFLVVLNVAGCRGLGNSASLDDAELQARLECSVQLANVRKAIAEACGLAVPAEKAGA